MAEIVNIRELNPDTFEFQDYSLKDDSLIPSLEVSSTFDPSTDYLEYFVFNLNNQIRFSNTSGYPNYTLLDNKLSIDPEKDLRVSGFDEGTYNTYYNILSNKLGSNSFNKYYISEISSDRTELRLSSTQLTDEEIISSTNKFIQELNQLDNVYPDFYLNFDDNQLVIANNIQLDGNTVLIKLYEPLSQSFGLKSELWVVEKIAESKAYNISITQTFDATDDNVYLQGPNLNLSVKDNINNSTEYKSFDNLSSTSTSQGSGSFLYQINNKLKNKGLTINIDYTDYSNFIHFSSAKTRLENFYYKLSLIEEYTVSASYSDNASSGSYYVSSSNNIWQAKINEIIEGFDGYEYHLYYNSGSTSWPKTGAIPPYTNEPTTNPGTGYSWFVTQSLVAEDFDLQNDDALINTVPEYLRDDPNNSQYELFLEMIGQQFDSIYLYLKDVTNKFNADNRLDYGISKDLVADAIRDLGVKIYQNNFSSDDVYTALIGIDPSGSLFGLPNTTGSLPTPAGYEYINTYVTASNTSSLYPIDDINKSIYKRIYHNLPYLLKKKGTVEGLRALITTFGIPDTILRISEFGGKDKNNTNDWDYWQNEYDYAFNTSGSGFVDIPWIYDYLDEYKLILSTAESNGYTLPTDSEKEAQNLFIYNLKKGLINGTNVWDSLDMLRLFANSNEDLTTIDYKDPTLPLGQLVNGPSFTQNVGLAGDGTFSTYYQTNFTPSTHAVNMVVGNGHLGYYRTSETTLGPTGGYNYYNGGIVAAATSRDNAGIAPDNQFHFALQNPTNNSKNANLGEQPINVLVSVKRGGDVSSNRFYGYIDTTNKGADSPTVLALPTTSYKALNGRNDNNAMIFSGASLTFAQMADLKAAIEAYLTTV